MESQPETTQTVSALKIPMLKTRDYDLWSMRMEQYLTHTNYALWKVIMNGDAPAAIASASAGFEGSIPPKTAEQKLARKNELKAKSTLLLAILDEHLLKFHGIKDAKSLWEAIKNRFGGNKESKKIQLEIHGEVISQEDANLKLLRNLSSAWNNIALIMRNKSDLDTLSMDDLYNNLKVYEAKIKGQSSSSSNSENAAFVSSKNTSSTNEAVNTAHDVSTIDTDDLEEMDLKWQVAMLTIRVKRFIKKTGSNLNFNGKETVGFDKTKVECYNCHKRGHFARESRAPRNQGNRNGDNTRKIVPVETLTNGLIVTDGMGYDWSYQAEEGPTDFALMAHLSSGSSSSSSSDTEMGLESLEARIVVHQKNEAIYEEGIAFLKYVVKNLTKLMNSQISAKDKTSLGYGGQMNESVLNDIHMNKSEVFESASDSSVNDNEEDNNQVNNRYKADDSVFKSAMSKIVTSVPETETSASKTSKESMEKPKTVRHSAPIIKEWESDSDDECVIRPSIEQNKPSYAKINFVKSNENTRKSVIEQHTYRQAENLRKSQSSRGDKRNWNGMMTQKLGDGFEFKKKACFVCGSLNHLIKDCNFYENKMVGKSVLNNEGKDYGQREVRPVWNNAQRVNHQNKFSHPHPKRNFVPTVVLTKSGQVPVNAAKQSFPRAAASISTVRPVNIFAHKPKVNDALPITYSYFKAHSLIRGYFNQKSAAKTNNFNEKVNTTRVNNVTTVGPKAVVSATVGNGENVVKSSTCWIWRPTGNVIDHTSKDRNTKGEKITRKGTKANIDAGQARMNIVHGPQYVLLPFLTSDSQGPKRSEDEFVDDAGKKTNVEPANKGERNGQEKEGGASYKEDDQSVQDFRAELDNLLVQQKEGYANSTNRLNTVSVVGQSFDNDDLPTDPLMLDLEDTTGIFNSAYDDENVGAEADLNNLETTMNVSPIPTTRIHKDHPKDQIIGDINSAVQTRKMTKISEESAMVSYINKQRRTNHKDYQNCLFACFLSKKEPKKVIQALADPSWIEAMQEELLQFKLQKVWTLVDLPKGKHAIGTKWVYRNKKAERGIVMDVKSAFLYGTIEEEVYVFHPPSFEDPQFPDKVYKVKKALYGLHQAPRAWYETLYTYLLGNGFRRGTIDKTLFIKKDKGNILLVQVYVDDIIFGSTKKSLCTEFEQMMHKRFQMSSMGELTFFLGLQVQQKEDGIFISQDKYVADILKKFDFVTVKTASTPIETNKALIKDEEAENVDVHLYRSMIRSLMYLTASRPDIMFSVCACARFQVTPKTSHLHVVKRIFRYLKGQPKLGLWYPRDSPFDLESFFDSDYARASLDRKSTTGEYVAAANCCEHVLWIQNQMLDYGFNFMNTKIYIDNESIICIVKNPVFHSITKHIEIRHHFIRDSYNKKLIQVIKIHTDHNVADLLTKAFDVSMFNFLIANIGLLNL
ncbi:putative ribonuclease H-like domain-containing protein [Tanacetum coccineum]